MTDTAHTRTPMQAEPLSGDELRLLDAYWRAANYLSVGQIYLLANPLLREPLEPSHIKPRLLGHWGTTPGLNLVYAHMNRAIKDRDLNALYVAGPGHGGPGMVANAYLEGTYSEIYSHIPCDESGLAQLFRQFSFPGGVPSHVAPETPGSIHEGGELGYSLAHAYGAVFDNPDLIVVCVVGDGEAETGPLATSWHANKFLNARTDGAVLPILHLNGYKIANPTILARIPEDELVALFRGYGYDPIVVQGGFDGEPPEPVHQRLAAALDRALDGIAAIQHAARETREQQPRPRPMLILRTPKGWTGPSGGGRTSGRGDVALAPGSARRGANEPGPPAPARGMAQKLQARRALRRAWRARFRTGRAAPAGQPSDERQSSCERGSPAARSATSGFPGLRRARGEAGNDDKRGNPGPGGVPPGHDQRKSRYVPPVRARRDGVEPSLRRLPGDQSGLERGHRAHRRPSLAGRPRCRSPLRTPLSGLARGLPPDRPAWSLQLLRGVHPHHRLDVQPAREVAEGEPADPVASPDRLPQLPPHLARVAPGPQWVFAPGPRLHRPRHEQEGGDHPGVSAAGREHTSLRHGPLPAEPRLRERRGRGQAAGPRLSVHGRRSRACDARHRDLGVGFERRGCRP